MLEKPDLVEEKIISCLRGEFGLGAGALAFLPLGADLNTAVYRYDTTDGRAFFCKLRRGPLNEISLTLPRLLAEQGIPQIIPPRATRSGELTARVEDFNVALYPFIEGKNAYKAQLSDRQWTEFGRVLKRIHTTPLPTALLEQIPIETYAPYARATVGRLLEQVDDLPLADPIAAELARLLQERRAEIRDLVEHTGRLAKLLSARTPEFIVCHSDLHAGNVHVTAEGAFYIVDWDEPIRAFKERDLMYAGGAQFPRTRTPGQEEALFYQGYGETDADADALAYYRCERIIQDMAVECEQVLGSAGAGDDRAQALDYFRSNFEPGGVLEVARRGREKMRDEG